MLFKRAYNRGVARLAARWPALARRLVESFQPLAPDDGQIPWTPFTKPLSQCKLALVTTAGIHHPHQPPYDMADKTGDPSFRILDSETIEGSYTITHDYYDHRDARRDLNIVFPLTRLKEIHAAGCIDAVSRRHFSFMGHITGAHVATLIKTTAPQVARLLREDAVDAVVLTPA